MKFQLVMTKNEYIENCIKLFIDFLKENDVYHKFKDLYYNKSWSWTSSRRISLGEFVYNCFSRNIGSAIFLRAFHWSSKDYVFWLDMNDKWVNYYEEVLKNDSRFQYNADNVQ